MLHNKPILFVLLLCLPLVTFGDGSIVTDVGNDVGDVIRGTGKGIENITNKVGNAISTPSSSTETSADETITAQVKEKLAANADIPPTISVSTTNGVVKLSGKVDTNEQANKAVGIAKSVSGVKNVDRSELKVSGG